QPDPEDGLVELDGAIEVQGRDLEPGQCIGHEGASFPPTTRCLTPRGGVRSRDNRECGREDGLRRCQVSVRFVGMRRQARLFALAEHRRARRTGVTAAELADRFGVTLRTIYRDLDALREAEMPISAERGRGGGFALDRTYSLPPVNFTAREAALLS